MGILVALLILGSFLFCVFIVWLFRLPVPPDPWESEIKEDDLNNEVSPVCLKCLKPINDPRQHYCPSCGNVTGEFTRYIPFVNIRFNYSIFGTLWKKINDNKTFFLLKIIYYILILALAPIMLLIGIPVMLYRSVKNKTSTQEKVQAEAKNDSSS
jgi:hypothetical protein